MYYHDNISASDLQTVLKHGFSFPRIARGVRESARVRGFYLDDVTHRASALRAAI